MKALVCPHCHSQIPAGASVCTGCGAEIVRGLGRGGRSFVGLIFVVLAILLFGVFVRAYEIANGTSFLKSPKAEDGPFALIGIIVVIVIPYVIGTLVARLIWRSKVRFFRSYRHQ